MTYQSFLILLHIQISACHTHLIHKHLQFHKFNINIIYLWLHCFDAVGWVAGRASGLQKIEWWDAGAGICLGRGADLNMAQLMSLIPSVSCFSKIHIGFTFLVQAHPGSPGQKGR